jgi:hypothetical protein
MKTEKPIGLGDNVLVRVEGASGGSTSDIKGKILEVRRGGWYEIELNDGQTVRKRATDFSLLQAEEETASLTPTRKKSKSEKLADVKSEDVDTTVTSKESPLEAKSRGRKTAAVSSARTDATPSDLVSRESDVEAAAPPKTRKSAKSSAKQTEVETSAELSVELPAAVSKPRKSSRTAVKSTNAPDETAEPVVKPKSRKTAKTVNQETATIAAEGTVSLKMEDGSESSQEDQGAPPKKRTTRKSAEPKQATPEPDSSIGTEAKKEVEMSKKEPEIAGKKPARNIKKNAQDVASTVEIAPEEKKESTRRKGSKALSAKALSAENESPSGTESKLGIKNVEKEPSASKKPSRKTKESPQDTVALAVESSNKETSKKPKETQSTVPDDVPPAGPATPTAELLDSSVQPKIAGKKQSKKSEGSSIVSSTVSPEEKQTANAKTDLAKTSETDDSSEKAGKKGKQVKEKTAASTQVETTDLHTSKEKAAADPVDKKTPKGSKAKTSTVTKKRTAAASEETAPLPPAFLKAYPLDKLTYVKTGNLVFGTHCI